MSGSPNNISQGQLPANMQIRSSRGRILMLKIALLTFFLLIAVRLVQIQVIEAPRYQEIARRQYEARVVLPATRGTIYDRNGRILVSNTMYVSFGADPLIVGNNAQVVAERFSGIFGKPRRVYFQKLASRDTRFVWLERRVNPNYAQRVRASDLEGVIQLNEPKRLYHYDHVAGQLIGFTDIDSRGLSGMELQLDKYLNGINGYVVMQRDGLGRKRPALDYPRVESVNGNNVALTIDMEIQAIVEQELRKGIDRNKAAGGLVIVMEPTTGEVLAIAQYPNIDPNDVGDTDPSLMRNRAITDVFEPGSVFKIVTASAALEHEVTLPDQKFFAENGKYTVAMSGGKVRTISDTHEHGMISFQQAMELSSNIVMAKVSDRIGAEFMYTMARNFGFGIPSGVGLPGEVSGDLKKPNQWSGATLNSMAFGYEVAVTPLQIASAYAAVANNGVLMKPFILKQVLNDRNEVIVESRPQAIRTVISKATAKTLTQFLEGVVQRGTGVTARLEGVTIAGKTGTSRKVVNRKYEAGSYTASFAGFFPAENPQIVCLVMLDNPRVGGYTGGLASAPIFKAIAEKIVTTSGMFARKPEIRFAGNKPLAVPDVMNLGVDVALTILESHGYQVETRGKGKVVLSQSPAPGANPGRRTVVHLATDQALESLPPGYTAVPDVRGFTIRRAINRLNLARLDVRVSGSGVVTEQIPRGGQRLRAGSLVTLQASPQSLSMVALDD